MAVGAAMLMMAATGQMLAQTPSDAEAKAPVRPVLERFLPDSTRWFLLIRDFPDFTENHLSGFTGTALEHPALKPLKQAKLTGASLPNPMAVLREFDLERLAQHIDGDVLIFCTQMGPLEEFNLDAHFDLVMAFHHRGQREELLELFEAAVPDKPADALTTMESIGGYDVRRIHFTFPMETYADVQPTPTPNNPRPTPNIVTIQAPMDYQFVITHDLAIFAEGSNIPLRDVLNKLSRPRDSLLASRPMRRAMTLLDDGETPLPGITLGLTQAFMQDYPPFDTPETNRAFDILGLKELQLVLLNLDTEERRHHLRMVALHDRDAAPFLGLAAFASPLRPQDFNDIPGDAIDASVTRYRMGDALRHLARVIPQKWPPSAPIIAMLPLEGARQLGVNPLDSILYQLGERHVYYSFSRLTAVENPLFVLRLGLNSPPEMAQTLSTATRHLLEANSELASAFDIIPEGSGELYALKVHEVDEEGEATGEPEQIFAAMGVGRSSLVISSDIGMLRKGIESEGSEGGFAGERAHARLLRRMPRGTFSMGISRPKPILQHDFQEMAMGLLLQLSQHEILEHELLLEAWNNLQALPADQAQQPVLQWEEHTWSSMSRGDDYLMADFSISPARLVPAGAT
mgnify:CR=1 FL=1